MSDKRHSLSPRHSISLGSSSKWSPCRRGRGGRDTEVSNPRVPNARWRGSHARNGVAKEQSVCETDHRKMDGEEESPEERETRPARIENGRGRKSSDGVGLSHRNTDGVDLGGDDDEQPVEGALLSIETEESETEDGEHRSESSSHSSSRSGRGMEDRHHHTNHHTNEEESHEQLEVERDEEHPSLASSGDMAESSRREEESSSFEECQAESLFDGMGEAEFVSDDPPEGYEMNQQDDDVDDSGCLLELQQVEDEPGACLIDEEDEEGIDAISIGHDDEEEAEDLFLGLPTAEERKRPDDAIGQSVVKVGVDGQPSHEGNGNQLTAENETEIFSRFVSTLLGKNAKINKQTLLSAIEDCYGRFILNLPRQYLTNHIQLCFAIQESYWWYDDYWFEQYPTTLPKLSIRNFGFILCELCPLLRLYFNSEAYVSFMNQWRQYCRTIPLKGAILINNTLTRVLMVQSWRGGRWMFPRGKVDEEEDDSACAVREVKEEVGVDVSKMVNPNVFIETSIDEQPIKLYLVPGILETTPFGPRKRKEIGRIRWIPVDKLPGWQRFARKRLRVAGHHKKLSSEHCADAKALRFWNVFPFVEAFVGWLDLLVKGMKARKATLKANPTDLMQNWIKPGSDAWPFSFPAPPANFNEQLVERYKSTIAEEGFSDLTNSKLAKHPEDKKVTEFYRTQMGEGNDVVGSPGRKKKKVQTKGKKEGVKSPSKQLCLSSLIAAQPAAAKSSPLPPFIDETKSYRVPQTTSVKVLSRLQYPKTFAPAVQSDHRSSQRRSRFGSIDDAMSDYNHQGQQRGNLHQRDQYDNGYYDDEEHGLYDGKHHGNTQYGKRTMQRREIGATAAGASTVGSKRILERPKTPAESGKALLDVLRGTSQECGEGLSTAGLMEVGVLGHLKKTADMTGEGNGMLASSRSILKDLRSLGLDVGQSPCIPSHDGHNVDQRSAAPSRQGSSTLDHHGTTLLGLIRGDSQGRLLSQKSWTNDPAIVSSTHLQTSEQMSDEDEPSTEEREASDVEVDEVEAVVDEIGTDEGSWDRTRQDHNAVEERKTLRERTGSYQEDSSSDEIGHDDLWEVPVNSRRVKPEFGKDWNGIGVRQGYNVENSMRQRPPLGVPFGSPTDGRMHRNPNELLRGFEERQHRNRHNERLIQSIQSQRRPSMQTPTVSTKDVYERRHVESELVRNHYPSHESESRLSPSPGASGVEEIVRLARLSYQAVNACRDRLGRPKFSMSQFVNILGLTEKD